MREFGNNSTERQPDKKLPPNAIEKWELSSRIAHEPGCDSQQLQQIEDEMEKLDVGENYQWTSEIGDTFTISKLEKGFYTLTFPKNYKRS